MLLLLCNRDTQIRVILDQQNCKSLKKHSSSPPSSLFFQDVFENAEKKQKLDKIFALFFFTLGNKLTSASAHSLPACPSKIQNSPCFGLPKKGCSSK